MSSITPVRDEDNPMLLPKKNEHRRDPLYPETTPESCKDLLQEQEKNPFTKLIKAYTGAKIKPTARILTKDTKIVGARVGIEGTI